MNRSNHILNTIVNSNINVLSSGGIIAAGLVAIATVAILPSTNAMADTTAIDEVNISVPVSCSFTAGGGSYSDSITAGATSTIVANNITTSCNDANGYSIYAIGYSDNTYDSNYHTDLIFSSDNTYNIKTNATGTNSNWKMKLTPVSDATISNSYDSFQNIPSAFTKVATFTGLTTASTITPSYQISISQSQPAGNYTGKVKYVLVHPNSFTAGNYSVVYNTNGGTGTNVTVSNIANYEPYTIAANTFTAPTGYQFAGWCTIQDNSQSPQTSCAGGTIYQPDDIATSLASAGGTFNLYANWSKLPTMQEFTSSDAAGMNVGDSATLVDIRDGESYTVAKLADNKVWMTTNLNIAGGTELSSTDTDFESTYTLPTTDGWTTNNGKLVLPASDSSGFGTDNYAYVYNTGNETSACTSPGCYSYYSWDAATLGSGRSISTDNTDAPYSICSKGWHLPNTYNGSGTAAEATDFRALMIALGGSNSVQTYNSSTTPTGATISSALQADPYNFLLGGYYSGGSFLNGGSRGYYWSATSVSSSTTARGLGFGSTGVSSASLSNRRYGFSVRCVFGE